MPYDTGRDILINVLSRSAELKIGSADREEEAKLYIQTAYISILTEGYPWPFAVKTPPGVMTTAAEVRDGGITTTNNSTTITFSSAPALSVQGYKIFLDTEATIYRIAQHTSGSNTATLDGPYLGDSVTNATYRCFQNEYNLADDFLKPTTHKFMQAQDAPRKIELIGIDEMRGRFQNRLLWNGTDIPRYCAFIGDQKIIIWPWTTKRKRFEYDYIFHPGTLDFSGGVNDVPIIQPAEDRVSIVLMAVGNLLVDKNDDRANIFLDAAVAKISSMKRLAHAKSRSRLWVTPGNNVATLR